MSIDVSEKNRNQTSNHSLRAENYLAPIHT